jgi:hypothetical protein
VSAYNEVIRELLMISSTSPPVRRRTRRSPRLFSGPTQGLPPASSLPLASLPIEPGGMVELALRELGARLVAVLPDDTPSV